MRPEGRVAPAAPSAPPRMYLPHLPALVRSFAEGNSATDDRVVKAVCQHGQARCLIHHRLPRNRGRHGLTCGSSTRWADLPAASERGCWLPGGRHKRGTCSRCLVLRMGQALPGEAGWPRSHPDQPLRRVNWVYYRLGDAWCDSCVCTGLCSRLRKGSEANRQRLRLQTYVQADCWPSLTSQTQCHQHLASIRSESIC
jgi:hypothetical protein